MEELGLIQLRLMLDDAVRPKVDWLESRGLLHNTHTIIQCQVPCSLVARHDAHDGYRWRRRRCNGRTSLRKGSFFKSKIELGKLVWLLFSRLNWGSLCGCYSQDCPGEACVASILKIALGKLVWLLFSRLPRGSSCGCYSQDCPGEVNYMGN